MYMKTSERESVTVRVSVLLGREQEYEATNLDRFSISESKEREIILKRSFFFCTRKGMYELKIIQAFLGKAYCQAHLQSIWSVAFDM